jgi:Zn-dependent oligopeptidase
MIKNKLYIDEENFIKTYNIGDENIRKIMKKDYENSLLFLGYTSDKINKIIEEDNSLLTDLRFYCNKFMQNIINKNNYELHIDDDVTIKQFGKDKFTLADYPNVITNCDNEEIREKFYKDFVTRVPENKEVIRNILLLRNKYAKSLGYCDYIDYVSSKMSLNKEQIKDFIIDTIKSKELDKKLDHVHNYYYYMKNNPSNDTTSIRIIDINQALEKITQMIRFFYKLDIVKVNSENLWNDKVLCYNLYEGEIIKGIIYLDLYSRDKKAPGAGNSFFYEPDGSYGPVCIYANFSDENHIDFTTLCHEFGHAIHYLLSDKGFIM